MSTISELQALCAQQDGTISDLKAEVERLTEELFNLEAEKKEQVGSFKPMLEAQYLEALRYIAREVGDIVYQLEQLGIRIRVEPPRDYYAFDPANVKYQSYGGGASISAMTGPHTVRGKKP